MAIVACGSSGTQSGPVGSTRYARAVKHADCMRRHGVPGFPDPSPNGAVNLVAVLRSLRSPAFRSALGACRSLEVGGGAVPSLTASQKLAAVEFSRCMRARGVTGYPDPQFSTIGYRLTLPPGLSQSSPAFKRAETTCNG